MATASSRPLRILCLHSFRTSASIMQRQMEDFSNFAASLSDLAQFSYLNAPHRCNEDAESKMPERLRRLLPPPYFEWWNSQQDPDGVYQYAGVEETLLHVDSHLASHGPYDGVLGFSQGGSLAHLLCLMQRQRSSSNGFRFGIIISARASRHSSHMELIHAAREAPLELPSLVIFGGKDTDVPEAQTRALMETLAPSTSTQVFLPDGTHRVPILQPAHVETCREFLEAQR